MNHVSIRHDDIFGADRETDTVESPASSPMVFRDDPVAMAVAVYRTHCEHPARGDRWAKLESAEISAQDRTISAEIRKYYADRIVLSMLRNKSISAFRRKLYGVVTNSMQLQSNDIGLLYRLPYFYQEDCAVDRVVSATKSAAESALVHRIQDKFTVIERVLRSRASGEYSQFWMQGETRTAAFLLSVKCDNPFHRMITAIVQRPVTLSAWAHVKMHKGHHPGWSYYMLGDIELIS